jgi:hypothetical protein
MKTRFATTALWTAISLVLQLGAVVTETDGEEARPAARAKRAPRTGGEMVYVPDFKFWIDKYESSAPEFTWTLQ